MQLVLFEMVVLGVKSGVAMLRFCDDATIHLIRIAHTTTGDCLVKWVGSEMLDWIDVVWWWDGSCVGGACDEFVRTFTAECACFGRFLVLVLEHD